jgi:hypothetical protein
MIRWLLRCSFATAKKKKNPLDGKVKSSKAFHDGLVGFTINNKQHLHNLDAESDLSELLTKIQSYPSQLK